MPSPWTSECKIESQFSVVKHRALLYLGDAYSSAKIGDKDSNSGLDRKGRVDLFL